MEVESKQYIKGKCEWKQRVNNISKVNVNGSRE